MNRFSIKVIIIGLLLSASTLASKNKQDQENYDIQTQQLLNSIIDKRVAILTNPSCIDSSKQLIFDVIFQNQQAYNFTLEYALAPEHGIRGDQDAGNIIYDYVDPQTNITVYSLYGIRRAPTTEMLERVDVIIHCILDVGTRFYTFDWTMSYAQEAVGDYNYNLTQKQTFNDYFRQRLNSTLRSLSSNFNFSNNSSKKEIDFIVLDRPNVLGGEIIEGCPLEIEAGYIGRLFSQNFTIPTRYAMTTGELAILFNEEYLPHKVHGLKVIQVPNYTRSEGFPNASLWVAPSPNMKTFETAYVYPGTGIFEQTNVSEGRGTDKPFQTIGAPFVNGTHISNILMNDPLVNKYARIDPITFIPTTSKWVNSTCGGIEITVLNKDKYNSMYVGTRILQVLLQEYPKDITLSESGSDKVFGTINFYNQINNRNMTVQDILNSCSDNLNAFKKIRENYLIYQ